jgi:ActR/RegA family two-component response regulator
MSTALKPDETPLVALIVEDEAVLALIMDDLLLAEGFETIRVATEETARAQADKALAVAVVDLSLARDVAGQRIIAFLRSQSPELPIVVVTGYAHDAEQADLRGLGGPTVRLHKPAHIDQLADTVWDVLHPEYLTAQLTHRERKEDRI